MLGVALVDKPAGITSHDVVHRLRRTLHTRRVGHSGTLDPLATGLLVMAVGPATRFLQYLPLEPKEYVGTLRFGQETTTQDADGEVVREAPVPDDLEARLVEVLASFCGLIEQTPPMYSAIKREGQPLYKLARQGIEVEREARTVRIDAIDLLDVAEGEARVRVVCSGGTYVRTLAHDIGAAVGCGAHLTSLRRTRVGKFLVEDAVAPDAVSSETLVPLAEALAPMDQVKLDASEERSIRQGQRVGRQGVPEGRPICLVAQDGTVVGIARGSAGQLQPECVLPHEATYGAL